MDASSLRPWYQGEEMLWLYDARRGYEEGLGRALVYRFRMLGLIACSKCFIYLNQTGRWVVRWRHHLVDSMPVCVRQQSPHTWGQVHNR